MSKTLTIYSASELKQVNPDAYQKAYEKFVQDCYESPHWADETVESLKAVIKHSGITLLDYEIQFSEYGWSSLVLEWPYEWGAEANASILKDQTLCERIITLNIMDKNQQTGYNFNSYRKTERSDSTLRHSSFVIRHSFQAINSGFLHFERLI